MLTLRPNKKSILSQAVKTVIRLDKLDPASALRLTWQQVKQKGIELRQIAKERPSAARREELERLAHQAQLPATLTGADLVLLDDIATLSRYHPALLKRAIDLIPDMGWDKVSKRLKNFQGRDIQEIVHRFIGLMMDDLLKNHPDCHRVLYAMLVFAGDAAEPQLRHVTLNRVVLKDSDEAIQFEDQILLPTQRANLLIRRKTDRFELDALVRGYLEHMRPPSPPVRLDYQLRHAAAYVEVAREYDDAVKAGQMGYEYPADWGNVTLALDRLADWAGVDRRADKLLAIFSMHLVYFTVGNHDPRWLRWFTKARSAIERFLPKNPLRSVALANIQLAIAASYINLNDFDKTLEILQSALSYAKEGSDRDIEVQILRDLSQAYRMREEYEESYQSIEQARAIDEAHTTGLQAHLLFRLGELQQVSSKYGDPILTFQAALDLFIASDSLFGQASSLARLGEIFHEQGDSDKALSTLRKAEDIFRNMQEVRGEANVLVGIGNIHHLRSQYLLAVNSYEAACARYKSIGSQESVLETLNLITIVREKLKPVHADADPDLSAAILP